MNTHLALDRLERAQAILAELRSALLLPDAERQLTYGAATLPLLVDRCDGELEALASQLRRDAGLT